MYQSGENVNNLKFVIMMLLLVKKKKYTKRVEIYLSMSSLNI